MADEGNLYLEPKRRLTWKGWLILGVVGMLLLAAGGLVLAFGSHYLLQNPASQATATMTLVPTFTPRPVATQPPLPATLSVRPWTDDSGPVGLVEVVLSLPAGAQVSHELPPGFRYWRGDLLQTRQGFAWNGSEAGEVRWYLLRTPDATLPATLEVVVNDRSLVLTLQPGTPATTSLPVE
ncbi:MAG: hypothetical protein JXA93_18695 [Anaerolineae bacterium]|nr:hypothetical protein [Anaerolineae bacterium]